MNMAPIRILLVEDNPADAILLQVLLSEKTSFPSHWTHVQRISEAVQHIAHEQPDVILLDLSLPDAQGLEGLTALQSYAAHLPIVVTTGTDDESLAVNAMHAGAQDYLVKGHIDTELLTRTLRYSIERKRAEEALRVSEERFRRYFELGLIGMAITSPTKGILEVNNELCAILGYEREELLTMNWAEITHPDDLAADLEQFERAMAGETNGYSLDKRWIRKDGKVIHSSISVNCTRRANGTVDYFVALIQDITERKLAEQALKLENERFQRFIDSNIVGIAIADTTGKIFRANDYFLKILGVTRNDFLHGKVDWRNFTPAEWLPVDEKAIRELRDHGVCEPYEKEYKRTDGTRVPVYIADAMLPGPEEQIAAFVLDLTERKQAEQAVASGQKRFQSLIEHAPDGIALLGLDGKLRQVTPSTESILGYTNQDAVGQDPALLTHPEDLPALMNLLNDLLQNPGKTIRTEYRFKHKDGSWRWLESTVSNLINEPSVQAIIFNYRDISERKQTEKKLLKNEEQYRSLFENSPISLWVEDFSEVKQCLDQLRKKGVQDISDYIKQHPEFIRECLASVKVLNVNSAAMRLYEAADKSSLIGHLSHIWPNLTTDQLEHELTQLANGQLSFEWEAIDQTLTGKQIYVNVHWSVVPGYEDSLAEVIVSTVDITERKQAEERIQRQLQRLSALRTIDMAISSSFDMQVSLEVILSEVRTQLGVDAAAILLFKPTTLTLEYAAGNGFHSSAIQKTRLPISMGVAGRVVRERHKVYIEDLSAPGNNFVRRELLQQEAFRAYYVTPLIAKGEVKGVLEIYHRSSLQINPDWLDFLETLAGQTAIAVENAQLFENLHRSNIELEQRVLERTTELNRTNAELERANRAKDEFLATMSHELRTPLNSILGLSESLLEQRRGSLNEYQQNSLGIVASSGHHLLELINDILDLSKIEAGMFDLYLQPVSVDEFCNSSLAFVRTQALKKSITLVYKNEAPVEKFLADPRRLKQIIINLLINAVKFTPEHGQVSLEVTGELEQGLIQFSVRDTGIGISAQDLKRLFQPFVQVDSSLNRQYEGTGLGLALVQKLTDLHGGSVQMESEIGKGSCFTINLPCKQEDIEKHEIVQAVRSARTREPNQGTGAASQQGRILLADDNMPNIQTIGDYLESHGYQIIAAHDGLEAINQAQTNHPDLILMDIQMPVINGLDAIERLRHDPQFASTPIIALTALAMPGDRERCLQAGATEYMSKPVSLKLLLKTVETMFYGNGKKY